MNADTKVTAEMSNEQIVAAMIANGAERVMGSTYITDWVEEGDSVGMTIKELVAEWAWCE
jgi:hypothetical protein